jgi:hypothetical protein
MSAIQLVANAAHIGWNTGFILLLIPVVTVCLVFLVASLVALFHPKKQRRDTAIAVLNRIPAPTMKCPRRTPPAESNTPDRESHQGSFH